MAFTGPMPHAAFQATCDACGVSRQWGIHNENTGAVVCRTCAQRSSFNLKTYGHGSYLAPSDATARPTADATACLKAI